MHLSGRPALPAENPFAEIPKFQDRTTAGVPSTNRKLRNTNGFDVNPFKTGIGHWQTLSSV